MDWLKIAGSMGFSGVVLGAFGSHALRDKLSADMMLSWNAGVRYHLIHAIAIMVLALYAKTSSIDIRWGGRFFLSGTVLFSGSLYVMCLTGYRALGFITPLGGICFLMGWAWMVLKLSSRP